MRDSSPEYSSLLDTNFKYYVIIESLGSDAKVELERLSDLIYQAMEKNIAEDALLAQNDRELKMIWNLREDVSVLAKKSKFDQHFDISLPIPVIEKEVNIAIRKLNKLSYVDNIFVFGHLADGNIHFIIGKSENDKEKTKKINEIIYKNLKKNLGSVSAEHGIGRDKKEYLNTSRSKSEINLMIKLKKTLDPMNILNSGRII